MRINGNGKRIGVIGAGTMGSIVIKRFATDSHIASIMVLDPVRRDENTLSNYVEHWYHDEYEELSTKCDLLVLAIKPQDFPAIASRLRNAPAGCVILSIMAGISLAELGKRLGSRPIARMMPSIAAQYGKAMVGLVFSEEVNAEWRATVTGLAGRLGQVMELAERHFDVFIALSGSGIAFALQVAHALIMGGVECGLSAEASQQIVTQMFDGAAATLANSNQEPQQLIRKICSAGGTTIAGVAALERGGLNATLMQAVRATVARAKELG